MVVPPMLPSLQWYSPIHLQWFQWVLHWIHRCIPDFTIAHTKVSVALSNMVCKKKKQDVFCKPHPGGHSYALKFDGRPYLTELYTEYCKLPLNSLGALSIYCKFSGGKNLRVQFDHPSLGTMLVVGEVHTTTIGPPLPPTMPLHGSMLLNKCTFWLFLISHWIQWWSPLKLFYAPLKQSGSFWNLFTHSLVEPPLILVVLPLNSVYHHWIYCSYHWIHSVTTEFSEPALIQWCYHWVYCSYHWIQWALYQFTASSVGGGNLRVQFDYPSLGTMLVVREVHTTTMGPPLPPTMPSNGSMLLNKCTF